MRSSSLADDGDLDMTDLFWVGEFPFPASGCCGWWLIGGGAETLGRLACRVRRLKNIFDFLSKRSGFTAPLGPAWHLCHFTIFPPNSATWAQPKKEKFPHKITQVLSALIVWKFSNSQSECFKFMLKISLQDWLMQYGVCLMQAKS